MSKEKEDIDKVLNDIIAINIKAEKYQQDIEKNVVVENKIDELKEMFENEEFQKEYNNVNKNNSEKKNENEKEVKNVINEFDKVLDNCKKENLKEEVTEKIQEENQNNNESNILKNLIKELNQGLNIDIKEEVKKYIKARNKVLEKFKKIEDELKKNVTEEVQSVKELLVTITPTKGGMLEEWLNDEKTKVDEGLLRRGLQYKKFIQLAPLLLELYETMKAARGFNTIEAQWKVISENEDDYNLILEDIKNCDVMNVFNITHFLYSHKDFKIEDEDTLKHKINILKWAKRLDDPKYNMDRWDKLATKTYKKYEEHVKSEEENEKNKQSKNSKSPFDFGQFFVSANEMISKEDEKKYQTKNLKISKNKKDSEYVQNTVSSFKFYTAEEYRYYDYHNVNFSQFNKKFKY